MRILILGGDGYLGWPTAMHLNQHGHQVAVLDSLIKRQWEAEVGAAPLVPVLPMMDRVDLWNKTMDSPIIGYLCDISTNRSLLYKIFGWFEPEVVVHYAEQPSAPYSMISAQHALDTQINNVSGTLNLIHAVMRGDPDCHIIKLGSMGEYGTPNIDIEEGWLDVTHKGRDDRMMFPKSPGSWYHASKVHDSTNLEMACRLWDLRVTDLNQGVVYGTRTKEASIRPEFSTSFHYDAVFGTVLNRFIVQAVCGTPLTVYGTGMQTRGFINIQDTVECIRLAAENPAETGEFRVINQMTERFSIYELTVLMQGAKFPCEVEYISNPRNERETHYYHPVYTTLESLGLEPHLLTDEVLQSMFRWVERHKHNADKRHIMPKVDWVQ